MMASPFRLDSGIEDSRKDKIGKSIMLARAS
jgi:hypothetical protein